MKKSTLAVIALGLVALPQTPAWANSIQTLLTPLADYSREDLGGCLEILYSKELQRTELYCPGAAGFEVTMTVGKSKESIFLKKSSEKFELALAQSPIGKPALATSLGLLGDQGIRQLQLRWTILIKSDGAQVTGTELLGLVVPVSFSYAGPTHDDFGLSSFLAVVRVDSKTGQGCVVEYVENTGKSWQLDLADALAEKSSARACLN
jgi:hypothetical protein